MGKGTREQSGDLERGKGRERGKEKGRKEGGEQKKRHVHGTGRKAL